MPTDTPSEGSEPAATNRSPEGPVPRERAPKKTKRTREQVELPMTSPQLNTTPKGLFLSSANPNAEVCPESMETEAEGNQPASSTPPLPASYKLSLRKFITYKKDDLEGCEDDTSDDEGSEEQDDPECPRIRLSKEDKIRIRRPWRRTLIIQLMGRAIGYNYLVRRLRTLWKPEGHMELIDLEHEYFLARFELQRDYDIARCEGPWIIQDHYLVVQQWKPNFRPQTSKIQKICAWVRLPDIPIEYFDEDTLIKLGDKIGKTIKIDDTTCLASRGKFARICVEIDITKQLLAKFTIEEEEYPIEYEDIHLICFKCGKYGHKSEACGLNEQAQSESTPETAGEDGCNDKESVPPQVPDVSHQKTSSKTHLKERFGPWMLVTRKDRRSTRRDGTYGATQKQNTKDRNHDPSTSNGTNRQNLTTRFGPLSNLEDDILEEEPMEVEATIQRNPGKAPMEDISASTQPLGRPLANQQRARTKQANPPSNQERRRALSPSRTTTPSSDRGHVRHPAEASARSTGQRSGDSNHLLSPTIRLPGIRTAGPTQQEGRGRSTTPRRAAAEDEHTLVTGIVRGQPVSRSTVIHRQIDPGIISDRPPPSTNIDAAPDEGADFFDCDTPNELMDEDSLSRSRHSLALGSPSLN
ncbi:PREDICTED: uncharacterized protein LOC109152077 [Ipomoea nil]|uniref:uncharacterized protein LOC109152077 n=1 Tax=Ipomoea nil TaxID=35883 RepID=UPI000902013C|nr:PREDICTED: uncharacterized protein LOC109152077 [Ipomoea nil]